MPPPGRAAEGMRRGNERVERAMTVFGSAGGGRHGRTPAFALLASLSIVLLLAGSVLVAERAFAVLERVSETGRPGYLMLHSNPSSPQWTELRPGQTVHWVVEAGLYDEDLAQLALELRSDGPLVEAAAMTVSVSGCATRYRASASLAVADAPRPVCPEPEQVVLSAAELAGVASRPPGAVIELGPIERAVPRQLLVSLSLDSTALAAEIDGAEARIGVGLHVSGEGGDVPPPPEPPLGVTGEEVLALALLAAGLIGVGAAAMLRAKTHRRTEARR